MRTRQRQDIADRQGDVDAFIAQEGETSRKIPQVAAAIGQRLLKAGRKGEALEILRNAAPKQETASRWDLDDDLAYGPDVAGRREWGDVWVEALLANGRLSEAQTYRWSRFESFLDGASLRAYLRALPEFDEIEAEENAIQHALAFPHLATALHFLIHWSDHDAAASLVHKRRGELDGNLYFIFDPAAKALEAEHPGAATILYRAMIEDTLQGAKSTRYGHAARHLFECQSLIPTIVDHGDFESHDAFVTRVKASHSRKTGFWSRVAELIH